MLEVKLKGFAELQKALSELPDKIERNIVRGALRAAAKVTMEEAKRQVPVNTGRLRDSIRVSAGRSKGRLVVSVKAGGTDKKKGIRAPHAHLVEFGTKAHFIKAKKAKSLFIAGVLREGVEHPGSTKRPFMRPAFDATTRAATLAFGKYVQKRLTKQGINTPDPEVLDLDDEA